MALFARKLRIPSPDEALPGRSTRMALPARHAVKGTPLEPPFPEGMERAIFGLGCFWGAERKFWQADGVYTTAVGYAGGHTPNPTYEEVCSGLTGHAEVVLVVYDPRVTSYDALLRIFWETHDPTQGMRQGNDVGTQYRSAIYWTTEAQRAAAEARMADPPGGEHTGERRQYDFAAAECLGDGAGMLTRGAAEAEQGELGWVVPLAQREFAHGIAHARHRNIDEARRQRLDVLLASTVGRDQCGDRTQALPRGVHVERRIAPLTEHLRKPARLDASEHQIAVGNGGRSAAAVAGGPGSAPAESGPTCSRPSA